MFSIWPSNESSYSFRHLRVCVIYSNEPTSNYELSIEINNVR